MNRNEAAARCWAEINMGAMIENYKTALSFLSSETTLIPVLKANAYGCGAEYVSQALYHEGARLFAVASLLEAVEIKRALPTDADVLVLGLVSLPELPRAIHENLVLTGFSEKNLREISKCALELHKEARVHLKVDTGLHRLGFSPDETDALVCSALLPGIHAEGLYTHLALRNREEDDRQFAHLENARMALENAGVEIPMLHACDSIGMVRYPDRHYGAVRAGAWLYGNCPYRYEHPEKCREVISIKCRVAQIRTVAAGSCVGYDDEHPLERETRVATLSAGYVDGFPRLNNKGEVLINGKRARVLGLVCMDQMMVDVTDIPEATEGDEATLLGNGIGVIEYAAAAGLNRNEAFSRIGRRIPRIYHNEGQVLKIQADIE
ncbi:MAG: alanine racemase [Clostridia bacterium]|nr:alanine racemase [Clostridia bacterium]